MRPPRSRMPARPPTAALGPLASDRTWEPPVTEQWSMTPFRARIPAMPPMATEPLPPSAEL